MKICDVPKLSAMLHNAAVQEATSSKKGPHKQSSSILGSQPTSAAASFQQSVCGIVNLVLAWNLGYSNAI
jgi:hypothetical protein